MDTLFDVDPEDLEPDDVLKAFGYFLDKVGNEYKDKKYKKERKELLRLYNSCFGKKYFIVSTGSLDHRNVYYVYPTILIQDIKVNDVEPTKHEYSITEHPFTLHELTLLKRLGCNKELITPEFFQFHLNEQEKIRDEKRKLLQIRQHLKQQKQQLDLERAEFEKQKQHFNEIDLDAYFKDLTDENPPDV